MMQAMIQTIRTFIAKILSALWLFRADSDKITENTTPEKEYPVNLNAEETKLIASTQKELANAKASLKSVLADLDALMNIQNDAKRDEEAADIYALWADFSACLASVHQAHAKGTKLLVTTREDGGAIVAYGPGGR
jgi:molecular chaperone GrpE (heat shock protein)